MTYAQAQELADDWINAGVPRSQQREVRVREFDLGFVCWAVDRASGPSDTAGGSGGPGTEIRMVIARESGASTLWPPLPVNEVVRQYEELYGGETAPNPAGAAKPVRGTVEATSFLLTPPQWLQEAGQAAIAAESARLGEPAGSGGYGGAPLPPPAQPVHLTAPPASGRPAGSAPTMLTPPGPAESGGAPASGVPAAGAPPFPHAPVPPGGATIPFPEGLLPGDPQGAPAPDGRPAQAGPPPVAGPPVSGPAAAGAAGGPGIEYAPTMLASDGAPGLMGLPGAPGLPGGPGAPEGPSAAGAGGRAAPGAPPPPPPAELRGAPAGPAGPGAGGRGPSSPPPPPPAELRHAPGGPPAAGAAGRSAPGAPPPPPPAELRGGGAQPAAVPAAPAPPAANQAAAGIAYEATQLAHAIEMPPPPHAHGTPPHGGPAVPPPGLPTGPGLPGAPGTPGVPPAAGLPGVPGMPPAPPPPGPVPVPGVGYGYPAVGAPGAPGPAVPPPPVVPAPSAPAAPGVPGVPSIGPGTVAVVSYRGPDGSEQKLIHRSEPGTPHPEWKAMHELRRLNVPPDQVLELHTDLELCDVPGGYCARMVRASWPNVRLSHTAPYGRDHQSRQAGMAVLVDHVDQLHQLAAAPQRPRPVRAPLPPPGSVPPLPPLAPQQLAGELGQSFGPGVFRFEQRAVSRQGVPEAVAHTLVWAGLPRDFAPFFWAHAQEGRPIPTLAELAAERGLPPGPDFGGYLVFGNDYGRQLCVQYGTAAVVAVEIEPGGEPPRFVNSGVPEFVRSLALLGRMWRLRHGLTPDQAGRWTTDFQAQLLAIDPAALQSPETWWGVLLEQFWDGIL
ncbi:SUKH-4 family immunity protein [Saccharothrix sp. ST-888]|uniref:SUKH-4 family immunity protein n=1 Tax=Saccharothrix sp. ST-888 TaxID=1427391 RepID=UPI0018CE3520|nr:SUKH-4 family immunity protein [Saccharothrix sp. ST-888]